MSRFLRRLAIILAVSTLVGVLVTIHDAKTGKKRSDFTKFSLAAAKVMYAGGNPYSKRQVGKNYKYLPVNAVVLRPFIHLSIPVAQGLWSGLNVALILLCFAAHRDWIRPLHLPVWGWFLAFVPTIGFINRNLQLGQWNTSVYCFAVFGLVMSRRRPWLAGLCLSLAAALKFLPALFLLYFVLRKRWIAAGSTVLGMLFWIIVLPSIALGPSRNFDLLKAYHEKSKGTYEDVFDTEEIVGHSLTQHLYAFLTPAETTNGNKFLIVNVLDLSPRIARTISSSVGASLFALLLGFTLLRVQRVPDPGGLADQLECGVWFTFLLLASPEARTAHFLTLFTPMFGLCVVLSQKTASRPIRRASFAVWLGVVALNIMNARFPFSRDLPDLMEAYGALALVALLIFFGALFILWPRPEREALDGVASLGGKPIKFRALLRV